jgi:hypothetical protein
VAQKYVIEQKRKMCAPVGSWLRSWDEPKRSHRMKLVHLLVPVVASLLLASPALACGGLPELQLQPHITVSIHFKEIDAHRKEALLALWVPKAPVVSASADGTISTVPVETAANAWVNTPTRFRFLGSEERGNFATVRVRVERGGKNVDESFLLTRRNFAWKVLSETSSPAQSFDDPQ